MRWQSAAWLSCALIVGVGCVEDAPAPTVERETRRLDGGGTGDAEPSDDGPDDGAPDAQGRADARWWPDDPLADATVTGPGCVEGTSAERDCPEGGTQSRVCGPAGWAPWTPCPALCLEGAPRAVEAEADAGELVDLGGLVFRSLEPRAWVTYEWVVVERPAGSVAAIVESYFDAGDPAEGGVPDDASTPGALFTADVPGPYVFELYVDGGAGRCAAPLARVVLTALAPPLGRLRVTLHWFTEGDASPLDGDGVNLDLHLLHPHGSGWFQFPWDCHAQNPSPAWGPDGPSGDPWLVADRPAGPGPEEVIINTPEETAPLRSGYCVGVHLVSRSGGGAELGATYATVRVFDGNASVGEALEVLDTVDQLWEVGCIDVAPGRVEVRLHDRVRP